ncbi:MAG: hypothetical protein IKQ35_03805 [Bacilli bacterium]|nr:hypothetical protein [Bacilli bacterium]
MNNENNNINGFEDNISLGNYEEKQQKPVDVRKKIIPILIVVLILFVLAIVFAFYYFGKDNRKKLICVGTQSGSDMEITFFFDESDKIEETEIVMSVDYSSDSEKEKYEKLKEKGMGICDVYKKQIEDVTCTEKSSGNSVVVKMLVKGSITIREDLKDKKIDELKETVEKELNLECAINRKPKISKKSSKNDIKDGELAKKDSLLDSIDSIIMATTTGVNDNEFGPLSNSENLYYIRVDGNKACVELEKGITDPFGNFEEAYVVVHYDPNKYSFDYYFTFYDDAGYGMPLTKSDNISKDKIVENHGLNSSNVFQTRVNGKEIVSSDGKTLNVVVISSDNNCSVINK